MLEGLLIFPRAVGFKDVLVGIQSKLLSSSVPFGHVRVGVGDGGDEVFWPGGDLNEASFSYCHIIHAFDTATKVLCQMNTDDCVWK